MTDDSVRECENARHHHRAVPRDLQPAIRRAAPPADPSVPEAFAPVPETEPAPALLPECLGLIRKAVDPRDLLILNPEGATGARETGTDK